MPVRALLHYALEVPDQQVGEDFYRRFGLANGRARGERLGLRPASLAQEVVLLYPGPRKRLHHLAFGAPAGDFEQVKDALRRAGVRETDPPPGAPEGGLWIRDPDGHAVNVRPEAAEVPPPDPPLAINSPGHVGRVAARGYLEKTEIRPRRLGHVLLFTPDLVRQLDFYTRVLGMRLSDRSRSVVAFLRCTTDHHNLAFLSSTAPGFHHGSFEVGSVDEIALGGQRMRDAGFTEGWGLGRHVIGSNFFYYVRDPWGSFAEYFHDIDHIPEACAWEPRDFPEQDALYQWGPPLPAYFSENTEAA
jgi:catechol 2,3-dioxygenase